MTWLAEEGDIRRFGAVPSRTRVAACFGSASKTTGTASFTAGANNTASGFASVAAGYNTVTSGQGAVALGYRVSADAD